MPKARHVHEIFVRAPADVIWHALTDRDTSARYGFGSAVSTVVKDAVPPSRLVLAFTMIDDPVTAAEAPSTVTWEIEPLAGTGICRVVLVHEDFGGLSRTWARTLHGWPRVLSGLKSLLETGDALGLEPAAADEAAVDVDVDAVHERELAIDCNNETWSLLGRGDRSGDDDEVMVRLAYAAAHHWSRASRATAVNEQRAEWLISRVLATLGRSEGALLHARRCLAITQAATVGEGGFADFDVAYAHEAMARALAASGDLAAARDHLARARAIPIADRQDREILEGDLAAAPWYGVG
jgi:uncharacterized protein YndB with AHSA1/START domain